MVGHPRGDVDEHNTRHLGLRVRYILTIPVDNKYYVLKYMLSNVIVLAPVTRISDYKIGLVSLLISLRLGLYRSISLGVQGWVFCIDLKTFFVLRIQNLKTVLEMNSLKKGFVIGQKVPRSLSRKIK